jgi:hypothetical protein
MRTAKLTALLLAPMLVLLMAMTKPLVDPEPVAVPAGLSDKAVAKAVRVGVSQRGWAITKEEPGYMEATLHLRTHMARIGITYDTRQVKIRYLESENLDYTMKNGVPQIHRNYLSWISNVVLDINVQLQAAAADLASG